MLAAALSSGVTAVLASNDWCFVAVTACLAGALIAGVADRFVWPRLLKTPPSLKVRLPIAVLTGCIVGLFFQLDQEDAFDRAFGLRPPEGITLLKIERHYAGGPGDEAILMEFMASREALEAVVARRRFDQPTELVELYAGNWEGIWRNAFSNFDVYAWGVWHDVKPMANPVMYRWTNSKPGVSSGEPPKRTTILWDSESGRAYALFLLG